MTITQNEEETKKTLLAAIHFIAPEVDITKIKPDVFYQTTLQLLLLYLEVCYRHNATITIYMVFTLHKT